MPQATITVTAQAQGQSFAVDQSVTTDSGLIADPSLPRAKVGTLTVRTDANTGTIVGEASHGVTTAAKLDVYWDGGKRVNMTVGTVSGTTIPIDLGTGDDLPVVNTVLAIMVPDVQPLSITGDNMGYLMGKTAASRATARIRDGSVALLKQIDLESAVDGYEWNSNSGETNPLAGVVAVDVALSHADPVTTRKVVVVAGVNN